tara:strand:+ start:637 stop:1440 length:804 start_codon:yes stop_codon:yes gene_type:complete
MYGGAEETGNIEYSDFSKIGIFLLFSIVLFIICWIIIKFVIGRSIQRSSAAGDSGSSIVTLVDKPQSGNKTIHIEQNPYGGSRSKFIKKSDDAKYGIEFSYSMWIYLDGYDLSSSSPKILFYKGSNIYEPDKQLPIIYCPLIYLNGKTNVLHVEMNSYSNPKEGVTIPDIPINKWINIIVAVNQINMDVYINGNLAKSLKLDSIPKQNNSDVFINPGKGFDGYISRVMYFNKYISYMDINDIVNRGPGKIDTSGLEQPRYLSNSFWY